MPPWIRPGRQRRLEVSLPQPPLLVLCLLGVCRFGRMIGRWRTSRSSRVCPASVRDVDVGPRVSQVVRGGFRRGGRVLDELGDFGIDGVEDLFAQLTGVGDAGPEPLEAVADVPRGSPASSSVGPPPSRARPTASPAASCTAKKSDPSMTTPGTPSPATPIGVTGVLRDEDDGKVPGRREGQRLQRRPRAVPEEGHADAAGVLLFRSYRGAADQERDSVRRACPSRPAGGAGSRPGRP